MIPLSPKGGRTLCASYSSISPKVGGLSAPHFSLILQRWEGSLRLIVPNLPKVGGLYAPHGHKPKVNPGICLPTVPSWYTLLYVPLPYLSWYTLLYVHPGIYLPVTHPGTHPGIYLSGYTSLGVLPWVYLPGCINLGIPPPREAYKEALSLFLIPREAY